MTDKINDMILSKDVEMIDLGVKMLMHTFPIDKCREYINNIPKIPRLALNRTEARIYHFKGTAVIRLYGSMFCTPEGESTRLKTEYPLMKHIDL